MHNIFPKEELNQRLLNVRSQMAHANVDGIVITVPENIYYLTALDDGEINIENTIEL